MGRAVRSPKSDRNVELSARHREHVGRVVYNLIESDERETEGHELDNRAQADHGRADAESGKTVFTNRGVDDAPRAEALEQALAHFVSAVVFRDFFAHQKHVRIALQ